MCIPMEHSASRPLPRKKNAKDRPARKRGPVARHEAMGRRDPDRPSTKLEFDQLRVALPPWRSRRSKPLYYKAGKDRLLTIVLTRDVEGRTSRSDVLLYEDFDWTAGKSCRPMLVGWAIECTFGELQAVLGLGGPCQSSSQGRRADRADGVVHLHSGSDLVSPDGSSIATLSVPALVHQEGRTIVRRYVDDPEAGQLPGKNPTTTSRTVWPENLDHPAHRPSQPNRVSDTSAEDPASSFHLFTIDSQGEVRRRHQMLPAIYETEIKGRGWR